MDKLGVLKEYFGHSSFREGQEELIDAVLSGRDVLGIMPTSAGKSVCYQIPALMLDGVAIVVSPLISLMKDQVNSLIQAGVRAAYLNSSLTQQQYETAIANAAEGMYKLIYVAPERLCTPSFLSFAQSVRLSLVAVDEAHCVSQWGQDFRPSYMRIPEFIHRLSYRPPIAAFTATATKEVKEDISAMLGLISPFEMTTGFDRKNLTFSVLTPKDKLSEVIRVIKRNEGRSGIIYCSTRKAVEEVCGKLREKGYPCGRYHAGLSDEERRNTQDDFIYDRIRYITATNAFGMGIDKSNVGFVIHYNVPKNIESYYQEAGRAGRDGEKAECVLLYSPRDIRTQEYLIDMTPDNPELDSETADAIKERDRQRLRQMTFYCTTTGCLREFILRYFGESAPSWCGSCSNCLTGFEECDVTVEAQKILSCIYRIKQHHYPMGAAAVTDVLRGSKSEKIVSRGMDKLSTYGIMQDVHPRRIRQITDRLIQDGCIRVEGEYNVLVLTNKAKGLLSGGERLVMKLPKTYKRERTGKKRISEGIYSVDQQLFAQLKSLRSRLAAAAHMPAYIVFTDATLRDICERRPHTEEELLECSGIGRSKAERYGKEILAAVAEFEQQGEAPLTERMHKARTAEGGTMLFKLIRFNLSKLSPADGELTLDGFCRRIAAALGVSADIGLMRQALDSWLLKNDYASRSREDGGLCLTILSDEAGLTEADNIPATGKRELALTPEGQRFILENAAEIFTTGGQTR